MLDEEKVIGAKLELIWPIIDLDSIISVYFACSCIIMELLHIIGCNDGRLVVIQPWNGAFLGLVALMIFVHLEICAR